MPSDADVIAWHRQQAQNHAEDAVAAERNCTRRDAPEWAEACARSFVRHASSVAHHTRAADAIEENARLRALLATLRTDLLDEANRRLGTAWGDSCGRRVAMIDGTIWDADAFAAGGADALRKPDAAD